MKYFRSTGTGVLRLNLLMSSLALVVPMQAAGPMVLLIGPPAAGKSTQAQYLKKELGVAIISADDLIARNPQVFERAKNPAIQGVEPRLDPALNRLVQEAMASSDLSKGVVLDGYPAAKTQADFLAGLREKFHLPKPIVIHLRLSDEIARQRAAGQKTRDLDQELKDYHRELDFARTYFPETDIRDIDASRRPDEVAKEIRRLLPK